MATNLIVKFIKCLQTLSSLELFWLALNVCVCVYMYVFICIQIYMYHNGMVYNRLPLFSCVRSISCLLTSCDWHFHCLTFFTKRIFFCLNSYIDNNAKQNTAWFVRKYLKSATTLYIKWHDSSIDLNHKNTVTLNRQKFESTVT